MKKSIQITAVLFVLAFALAPIGQGAPSPDGGPTHRVVSNEAPSPDGGPTHRIANDAPSPDGGPNYLANDRVSANMEAIPEGENLPIITIHSTDNVSRGKTGSFVLDMKPRLMFGATFVQFSVNGTAIQGVDYVALVSPAFIGQSGYGSILVQTLPDPRDSSNRQAYSVVVTLKPGLGYWVGQPSSATMWIKP